MKANAPRIVIVDDEPAVLDCLELVIQDWSKQATILRFSTAEKALEALLREDPDLLITDDAMAGLSGYDLIQRLLDRDIPYPIVMVSCWPEAEKWVQEHAGYGLNISYLPRPFSARQLRELLDAHLRQMKKP